MADNNIMDWDSTIEDDGKSGGSSYIVLPEGDYDFVVTGMERAHFPGSAKIPACNKMDLTLTVKTDKGMAEVKESLILYKTMEWKLSAFFRSIGLKKFGQPLVMDWSAVPGALGRAHFVPRKWTGKDGNEHESNAVDKYIDAKVDANGMRAVDADSDDDLPF